MKAKLAALSAATNSLTGHIETLVKIIGRMQTELDEKDRSIAYLRDQLIQLTRDNQILAHLAHHPEPSLRQP